MAPLEPSYTFRGTVHSLLRGPGGPVYPQVLRPGDVILYLYSTMSVVLKVESDDGHEIRLVHYRPEAEGPWPKIDYVYDLRKV